MCSREATLPGHTHLPLFQCEHHATFMITNKVIMLMSPPLTILLFIVQKTDT